LIIIIINDSSAANQQIRVISEGSCDTEDWRCWKIHLCFPNLYNQVQKYVKCLKKVNNPDKWTTNDSNIHTL